MVLFILFLCILGRFSTCYWVKCSKQRCVQQEKALRFGAYSVAFCSIQQCVLQQIAFQRQRMGLRFLVFSAVKLARFFLKQKRKSIVNNQNKGRKGGEAFRIFSHFAVFYLCFGGVFEIEWLAKEVRFIKYIYRINNLLVVLPMRKKKPSTPLWANGKFNMARSHNVLQQITANKSAR